MKRLFFLGLSLLILSTSFSTSTILAPKKLNATTIFLPVGKTGNKISLMELSTIKLDQLETLTGRKMNFAERIAFKTSQRKLRKGIAADGTVESKKITKLFDRRGGDTGFHFGGFALGFFLGLIGVLIAYLIDDDFKSNRVKWAWIGCGIGIVLSLIFVAIVLSSI